MAGDSEQDIRQHQAIARGAGGPGYGKAGGSSGSHTRFSKGGSVGKSNSEGHSKHHGVGEHSGHHNMDGGLDGNHHHTHKSHGHGYGVQHHKTGGIHHAFNGEGVQFEAGRHHGPSKNQFGGTPGLSKSSVVNKKW